MVPKFSQWPPGKGVANEPSCRTWTLTSCRVSRISWNPIWCDAAIQTVVTVGGGVWTMTTGVVEGCVRNAKHLCVATARIPNTSRAPCAAMCTVRHASLVKWSLAASVVTEECVLNTQMTSPSTTVSHVETYYVASVSHLHAPDVAGFCVTSAMRRDLRITNPVTTRTMTIHPQ